MIPCRRSSLYDPRCSHAAYLTGGGRFGAESFDSDYTQHDLVDDNEEDVFPDELPSRPPSGTGADAEQLGGDTPPASSDSSDDEVRDT